MRKLGKLLTVAIMAAASVLPAGSAVAQSYDPCKGTAPGPHCRPACFYYVYYDEGDPANGVGPTVEIRRTFC